MVFQLLKKKKQIDNKKIYYLIHIIDLKSKKKNTYCWIYVIRERDHLYHISLKENTDEVKKKRK